LEDAFREAMAWPAIVGETPNDRIHVNKIKNDFFLAILPREAPQENITENDKKTKQLHLCSKMRDPVLAITFEQAEKVTKRYGLTNEIPKVLQTEFRIIPKVLRKSRRRWQNMYESDDEYTLPELMNSFIRMAHMAVERIEAVISYRRAFHPPAQESRSCRRGDPSAVRQWYPYYLIPRADISMYNGRSQEEWMIVFRREWWRQAQRELATSPGSDGRR